MEFLLPGLTFVSIANLVSVFVFLIGTLTSITIRYLDLIISGSLKQVFGSGRFEVSILAIRNTKGQREDGHCCAGSRDLPPCTMECQTFFSVCLQHFTFNIPERPMCTFGKIVTPVLGGNNINESQLASLDAFPIKVQFNFSWPQAFILVIDVWHNSKQNRSIDDLSQRIHRAVVQDKITPPSHWISNSSNIGHIELKYQFRVVCDDYYYGADCQRMCRDRNDRFGHYVCDENGTIVCLPGWEGKFCETAYCTEKCNISRGYCEKPFQCRCYLGWTGETCDKCKKSPSCLNGYCFDPWQCLCYEGWTGKNCDIDLNYCAKHTPCLHGGSCNSDQTKNFTCTCRSGFGGKYCQVPTCYQGYCLNDGKCNNNSIEVSCSCDPHFYGRRCEHKKVYCDDVICSNNGTCYHGKYGARCACTNSYTGSFCETKINACLSNPCANGGTCLEAIDGYVCKCQNNYFGRHCNKEPELCQGIKCFNKRTCGFMKKCICSEEYTGLRCEIALNPCHDIDCFNNGNCIEASSRKNVNCQCRKGFSGRYCEGILNSCIGSPCLNDASSEFFTNYSVCVCDHRFAGSYCHVSLFLTNESVLYTTPSSSNNVNSTSTIHSNFPNLYFLTLIAFVFSSLIIVLNTRRWCLRHSARTPD